MTNPRARTHTRQSSINGLSGDHESKSDDLKPSRLVKIALVFAVIGASGAFQVYAARTIVGTLLIYGSIVAAAFLLFFHFTLDGKAGRTRIPIAALLLTCGIPLASSYWSLQPTATMVASLVTLLLAATGAAAAWEISIDSRMRLLAYTLGALLVVSLAVVLIDPSVGIDDDTRRDAYRGVFTHKNSLGRIAAIEFILALSLALNDRARRRVWLFAALFSAFMLYQSGSQTALVAAIGASIAMTVVWMFSRTTMMRYAAIPVLLLYLVSSFIVELVGPRIAEYLSRDETLTGRTHLWMVARRYAEEQPLLGWGFGSVWTDSSSLGQALRSHLSFDASSAHSGFIDIRLQVGWLGYVLMLVGLSLLLTRYCKVAQTRMPYVGGFALVVLILMMDLTESTVYFGVVWLTLWALIAPSRADQDFENDQQAPDSRRVAEAKVDSANKGAIQ